MRRFSLARRLSAVLLACALSANASAVQLEEELVPFGATWRYLDSGIDPGANWTEASFDDSVWELGPAQLGYGEGDEATVVSFGPDPLAKHVTTWFRTTFEISDPTEWRSLRLFAQRDDGIAVWLNGELLRRDRLPWSGWMSDTLADGASDGAEEAELHGFDQAPFGLVMGTNVLAVEVHQAAPDSDDLSFDLQLLARRLHGVLRGPYLQLDTPTSMRVRWSTAKATYSSVRYGEVQGSLTNQESSTPLVTEHSILLTGLQPETTYYYDLGPQVGDLLPGRDYEFRTPPLPDTTEHRIWFIGDSGTANAPARSVRDGKEAEGGPQPDLWIMLGDNAYPQGDPAAYQRAFFDMYPAQLSRTPVITVRGNHENDPVEYFGIFDLPTQGGVGGVPSGTEAYYSVHWGNVHFVCLDSSDTLLVNGGDMYTWLEADLAASDAEWLIAAWHHPPYSKGSHDSDVLVNNETKMRTIFLPLLEEAGVDLVMAGHSHGYERSFLIDSHYGVSTELVTSMIIDGGDGNEAGDGAYSKPKAPHQGTVYSVAGNGGNARPADYNHPIMVISGPILGSVMLDIDGPRLDYQLIGTDGLTVDSFTLLHDSSIQPYCDPTPHSGGCEVTITWDGQPSVTGAQPFLIHADHVLPNVNGLMVYGFGPDDFPLFEGSLCVAQPLSRRPVTGSGGSGPCEGRLTDDFGAHLTTGVDLQLQPGETVYAQFWYRDIGSSTGANFSQALSFVLVP